MQPNINVRAIVIGLLAFPILYSAGSMLLHLVIDNPSERSSLWLWAGPIFAAVIWLLPGFTTGYIAKRAPLVHGVVLGFGSVIATLVVLGALKFVVSFSPPVPLSLAIGFLVPVVIGSCIGAAIGHLVATRRKAP